MRILLIEDDHDLSYSLAFQLEKKGCQVDICEDGGEAEYYTKQQIYDLILLDRMLPHVDGMTILKKLRSQGNVVPVILLTALGEISNKIDGLDAGADDYLVKPFDFEELLARIRCIRRRPRILENQEIHSYSDISYNSVENILTGPKGSCTLSKKEGALLEYFLLNRVQTLPRMTLLVKVWGPDAEVEEGNLDNYVYFIRRRIKSVGSVVTLKTVRGVGYRLE
ncbi:MAG: response regulator transcription factor [Lachnospiraceae bacterium]|nr:response regulator transcription factor [Lachnospiraceae bacterium]